MGAPWEQDWKTPDPSGPWNRDWKAAAPPTPEAQAAPPAPEDQAPIAGIPGLAGLAAGTRAATRGFTAGLSDYVDAAARYGVHKLQGKDTTYNDELKADRADVERFRQQSPVAAYGNEIAGAVVSPVFKGSNAVADDVVTSLGGQSVPRYAQYAIKGAVPGAVAGAGNAQGAGGGLPTGGDVAKSTSVGATGGAVLGALVPAVAEGAAKVFKGTVGAFQNVAMSGAKTADDFRAAAQAAYKASEDAGVVISPEAMQKFAADLPGELKGYHPIVNEKGGKIISMLQTEADKGPMTLSYLDGLRSVASGESLSRDANDARIAGAITHKIDDFIDNLKPADLASGIDGEAAKESLVSARDLWKTKSKLTDIERIVDTGENLNEPNWVKNQFRAIVRNPTKFNRYTEDEQKAIVDIARTGILEHASKIIPWRGLQMSSTYAAPLAQTAKVNALQNLVAAGGPGRIFGSQPPPINPAILGMAARSTGPLMAPFMSSMRGGSNQ